MEFGILSKIYDAIKGLPKTSGGMKAGEFKEKAIRLGSEEKDITNCVFSVTGKGKLHAAWLGGFYNAYYVVEQYRWGLKVVIDDEVVFDVQKKHKYEGVIDVIKTVGFITPNLYLGDNERVSFVAPPNDTRAGICQATFDMLTNGNGNGSIGSFDSYGNCSNSSYGAFSMCVIPDKPCTSYTLAGRTDTGSSASISVGSIIPEPLIFNKSVKVYASNKVGSGEEGGIVRVAYTLEV